jgi:oxygen-independent coproporphyrinogen-3 oxidase
MDDYLGFGPAAHSLRCGVRIGHNRDVAAYLQGKDITEPEEILTQDAEREEYVMLRLRLSDGVNKADYAARFGESFDARYQARLAPFVAAGYAISSAQHAALTDRGFDVSNHILSELLF